MDDFDLVKASKSNTDTEHDERSKLHAKYRGPFKVTKLLQFDNYQIALPPTTKCHNIFHISDLLPYTAKDHPDLLEPAAQEDDMYLVERIAGHRLRKGKVQYLIMWKGYSKSHNTYEPYDNLKTVRDMVIQYHKDHNIDFTH